MVYNFINIYKEEIKKSINDLKNKKEFYKQIPNLLTFLRLTGAIPAGILFYINPTLSISMIAFLWFTDSIDGRLAKKFNAQSKLGADMDAVADKIMFLASSLPLMSFTPNLIYSFILEGIISLINVVGRIKNLDTKTVLSGKIKTISLALTLVSGYFAQFFNFPLNIVNILTKITILLQFVAIKDYTNEFARMNKELKNQKQKNNQTEEKNINLSKKENNSNELKLIEEKNKLDELKKEREFYLDFSKKSIQTNYEKKRTIERKKSI